MTPGPKRPRLLTLLIALAVPAAAYLVFELGRYQAGFALLDRQREMVEFERRAAERDATIDTLERQLAIAQTSQNIDRETYERVETSLSDLEAKLQAQEEELAFYRGIISPADGVAGLKIQGLEIESVNAETRFIVRLVLMQAIIHNREVSGTVDVSIEGALDGELTRLSLEDVVPDAEPASIEYEFRYFQGLERTIELPEGFEPESVDVEVWPEKPRGDPLTRRFAWNAVSGNHIGE